MSGGVIGGINVGAPVEVHVALIQQLATLGLIGILRLANTAFVDPGKWRPAGKLEIVVIGVKSVVGERVCRTR